MHPTSPLFFFIGAGVNLILTPLFIRLAHKHGLMDHPGHRKIHTTPVAKLGGVAIVLSILAAVLIGIYLSGDSLKLSVERQVKITFILTTTLLAAFLGFLDDLYTFRPRNKFLFQILLFGAFTLFGFRFDTFHFPGMPDTDLGLFSIPFTLFWILAVVNGFNFMDGVDGLAGTVTAICFLGMGTVGYIINGPGQAPVVWNSALGAILVFIAFNWKPAKIYLGDSGSMALGTLVATSLISMGTPSPTFLHTAPGTLEPIHFKWVVVTFLIGYPAMEMTLSFIRRFIKRTYLGRSIEFSEKEHIHHQLLKYGFSAKGICFFAAFYQSAMTLTGIFCLMKQNAFAVMTVGPLAMVMAYLMPKWGFFDYLGEKANLQKPHFKIANFYISIQKIKLSLAAGREETLALVDQTCREFGVRCFRIKIKPAPDGTGGMDYSCQDTKLSLDSRQPKPKGTLDNHENEFYDFCETPGHRGEAFWVFDVHTSEDELDIEYRVLVSSFMSEALSVCIKLGAGKDNLTVPSVQQLPHHRTSGHELRKKSAKDFPLKKTD